MKMIIALRSVKHESLIVKNRLIEHKDLKKHKFFSKFLSLINAI